MQAMGMGTATAGRLPIRTPPLACLSSRWLRSACASWNSCSSSGLVNDKSNFSAAIG